MVSKTLAAMALLLMFACSSGSAFALYQSPSPWAMYRHDLARSALATSTAPDTNASLLWTSAHGYTSPPLVADGRVITIDGYYIYCLDETTAVVLWGPVNYHGYFYDTGSYVNGLIYVGTDQGYLLCINATDGSKIWEYQIPTPGEIFTSPAVSNGRVYFGTTNNYLYALNTATGLYIWRYTTPSPIYSSPAVDGTMIYFGCDDGNLYALNDTGSLPQKRWNFGTAGQIRSTPMIADGKIFFGSASNDHSAFALNETTGTLMWKFTTSVSYATLGSAAFANGLVFIGASSDKVYALYSNATIGNYTEGDPAIQFWSQTLSSSPTAPCIATGKVFVSAGSTLYAFDMYSQKTLWYYTWSGYYAYEPVVADGHVFVPQYYGLSCFGEPFPPITYDFTVSVNGQPFVIELVANATVLTIDTSSLTTLKQIVYNLTGISGTTGMSNITMPKTLMSGFDASSVTVDGGLPLSGPVISENATHTSLYFTYTQSSHEVVIKATSVIPEYSPVLLLPLLLGTPLVVLAIARRKRII